MKTLVFNSKTHPAPCIHCGSTKVHVHSNRKRLMFTMGGQKLIEYAYWHCSNCSRFFADRKYRHLIGGNKKATKKFRRFCQTMWGRFENLETVHVLVRDRTGCDIPISTLHDWTHEGR